MAIAFNIKEGDKVTVVIDGKETAGVWRDGKVVADEPDLVTELTDDHAIWRYGKESVMVHRSEVEPRMTHICIEEYGSVLQFEVKVKFDGWRWLAETDGFLVEVDDTPFGEHAKDSLINLPPNWGTKGK